MHQYSREKTCKELFTNLDCWFKGSALPGWVARKAKPTTDLPALSRQKAATTVSKHGASIGSSAAVIISIYKGGILAAVAEVPDPQGVMSGAVPTSSRIVGACCSKIVWTVNRAWQSISVICISRTFPSMWTAKRIAGYYYAVIIVPYQATGAIVALHLHHQGPRWHSWP